MSLFFKQVMNIICNPQGFCSWENIPAGFYRLLKNAINRRIENNGKYEQAPAFFHGFVSIHDP